MNNDKEYKRLIKRFSEELPHFPDGRINYSNSKEAPVLNCFVEFNGKILLLKRSDKVANYQGKWNSVGGYLDDEKPFKEKVFEELSEELGISKNNISEITIGKSYKLHDKEIDKIWHIFPAKAKLRVKPMIKLDWEHSEFKWIEPSMISSFDTVVALDKVLERVLNYREVNMNEFLQKYESEIIPLSKKCNEAYFDATISGDPKNYQKAGQCEIELIGKFTDQNDFHKAKELLDKSKDYTLSEKRIIELIHKEYLSHQSSKELQEKIIKLQTEIEETFNTFRVKLAGKVLTDNEVDKILIDSTDSKELEGVWEASKEIGKAVENKVLDLVKLRNIEAKELGYNNFHEASLSLSEQTPEEIEKIFDEADRLTREKFQNIKKDELDVFLAQKHGISSDKLMPWHYQNRFFQEAPKIYRVDLDALYRDRDLVQVTSEYFDSIDLPIKKILEKSDLFEKPKKYQHAYCLDVDRSGDIRVVCNVKKNQRWMDTLLHEFGHAVYDFYIDPKLHWVLRRPAHIFTTEGVALFFGKLASNAPWIEKNLGQKIDPDFVENCRKQIRLEKIIFSRWSQVMYRFEKAMYENPDQNLNLLWWNLVEKYQGLKRPKSWDKPYWAAKIHVVSSPAYYHNYLMGDFFASQLQESLKQKEISFTKGDPKTGLFFKESVFASGALYRWDEYIKRTTGKEFSPEAFAKEYL